MQDYQEFLKEKMQRPVLSGFDVEASQLNSELFLFQRDIVRWALRLGKAAIFASVGLGKTIMQLEWAHQVNLHTGKQVLLLAPLAVSHQTVREGQKFGIEVVYRASAEDVQADDKLIITNYERLEKFDSLIPSFAGVVLDESSILKSLNGKIKQALIAYFEQTPYKLACSATPAPNDHMELGNHSEFLQMMPQQEMLARWFVHDSARTQEWRLKGHGQKDFWRWLTSWAVCITKPSDLGNQYAMPDYNLPKLNIIGHYVAANEASYEKAWSQGRLLPDTAPSSTELGRVKRLSLPERIEKTKELVASIGNTEPILIWCELNDESDALMTAFKDLGAVEVRGSDKAEVKAEKLLSFSDGKYRILITKASIAGFGMNWQHCNQAIFFSLDFSFESFYQAKGRNHRYGQTREVNAHVIYSELEGNVVSSLYNKQEQFETMQNEMTLAMKQFGLFRNNKRLELTMPESNIVRGKDYTLYLGDCIEQIKNVKDESVGFSVYSPPFSQLYVYSDSEADMGNSANDDEFMVHYTYLIKELYRTTQSGRLSAVHCMDLPSFKGKDGFIGLKDFSGQIIKAHQDAGWIYHTRITIWKNPVVEMQRTKAVGLLHKQFVKDSTMSRVGTPDYLLVFRKDGTNEEPVTKSLGWNDYVGTDAPQELSMNNPSIDIWQRYASPVWFDVDQTKTLNYRHAKDNQDEKHICPLQLDVIERAIQMWSNPSDVVLSPFAGIGSEPFTAIKMGRKAIGIELKQSYFDVAVQNCKEAERQASQRTLFDLLDEVQAGD